MPATVKPDNINLTFYAGSHSGGTLVWSTRATSAEPWVPVNLTGYSARMQFRKTPGSAVVLDLHTGAGGGITLGVATGEIHFDFDFTPSSGDDGGYLFDLLMTAQDGKSHRIVQGRSVFEPGITELA